MDNGNNNGEDIFSQNHSSSNGFKKVNLSETNHKTTSSYYSGKSGRGFKNGVFIPFVSGVIGATLVLGVCIGVPGINNKLFANTSEKNNGPTVISQTSGPASSTININDYSNTAISVAKKVLPSVVSIEIEYTVTNQGYSSFYGMSPYGENNSSSTATASGSGVIISKDGYILTNNHVVNEESSNYYYQVSAANKITVTLYNDNKDEDAKKYEAQIVGTDSLTDLAVLKIDATDLTAAELGDSSALQVGEFVMAVGNPLDMPNTVTSGIVSALNREITDDDGTEYKLIQTDTAINAGNSGGALVNADGKVIGINTLKLSGESIEGIGFAIPINDTTEIINQLITYNKVKRPYLGISGSDVTEEYSKYYNVPQGVYVNSIEKDGPAEAAGIKSGDIITKIDDTDVKSMTELTKAKNKHEIGDTVSITLYRNGKTQKVTLTLDEMPDSK